MTRPRGRVLGDFSEEDTKARAMDSPENQEPNVAILVAATTAMTAALFCLMFGAWMVSSGRCTACPIEDEEQHGEVAVPLAVPLGVPLGVPPPPVPPPVPRQRNWSGVTLVRQPDGGGALGVPSGLKERGLAQIKKCAS